MKYNIFRHKIFAVIMPILATLMISCSDDDTISISRICVQKVGDSQTELRHVRLGEKIRIEGKGLSTTKAVYCNGVEIKGMNANYVTDNSIILTIPKTIPTGSEIENEDDRNTIRIVTAYDNFVFPFSIMSAAPNVTSVSHTMPRPGEWIEIYGSDLKDIEKVTFPGNIVSTNIQVNSDYTVLSVEVPADLGNECGALTVEGFNGGAYSHNYFNCKDGLFIVAFTDDPSEKKSYWYGRGTGSISANKTAKMPVGVSGPQSPDVYRSVPSEPKPIPTATEDHGGFNFYADKAIDIVLKAYAESKIITEDTPVKNLAIQCDYYVSTPWSAGALRLMLNGVRSTPLPWLSNGTVVPVDFSNGWKTMTWPLSDMKEYADMTLGELHTAMDGKSGVVYWTSGSFQDNSGNWFSGLAMESSQMSFGNFRIVPYVKSTYKND